MKAIPGKMLLAGFVLALGSGRPASAGRADLMPVQIVSLGSPRTLAYGSLGSTRNDTSDSNQYIRCESVINPALLMQFNRGAKWSGSCSAHKGSVTVNCNYPDFAQGTYQRVMSTMTSDSLVQFIANSSTQNCEALYVSQYSSDEPKR